MTRDKAMAVWELYFEENTIATDPFGVEIHKANYDQRGTNGWNIDHIWPLNSNTKFRGSTDIENCQPMSFEGNEAKANSMSGEINDCRFSIRDYGNGEDSKKIGQMAMYDEESDSWYDYFDDSEINV